MPARIVLELFIVLRWLAILACLGAFVATTTADIHARELSDVPPAFDATKLDSLLGPDSSLDDAVATLIELRSGNRAPSLVERVLVAEDLTRQKKATVIARFESFAAQAKHTLASIDDERDRCIALHTWLHARLLTGKFKSDCHRLSEAVLTGNFNCFTATVLYADLARQCHLNATPVLAAAHVFVRVTYQKTAGATSTVDVETTCPSWFSATPAQQRDWLDTAIGQREQDQSHAIAAPREITSAQLAGVYFYNQGVDAFRRRDFAGAARLASAAIRLDPRNQPARDNQLAALNNLALQHAAAGERRGAQRIVDFALRIDRDRADLLATRRYLAQCAAAEFVSP